MHSQRVLLVDGHLAVRKPVADFLRSRRHSVLTAETLADAFKFLEQDRIDLVFIEAQLQDGDAADFLKGLIHMPCHPLVVVTSSNPSVESVVECMRLGACDFLIKPFSTRQVEETLKKSVLLSRVVNLNRPQVAKSAADLCIIGNSQPIVALKQLIQKVAPTDATVLIHGENGTGKELVSSDIYKLSFRADCPFVKINCAAVSETLMESEFFGHEKGSFTGAAERREGRFELANGGTLLLDEISEIPPRLQAKLLRVLQEREFERVGGAKTLHVDVRVLATTNRDMKKAVANGEFREDLYHRLNVFPLNIPPLRERGEDMFLLANHFLDAACKRYNRRISGFADRTLEAMKHYPWTGNVRELQNCVERAVILSTDESLIEVDALGILNSEECRPDNTPQPDLPCQQLSIPLNEAPSSVATLEELEKRHILHTLSLTKGNRTHAAELLKISIRTLRNKLHEYKINNNDTAAA